MKNTFFWGAHFIMQLLPPTASLKPSGSDSFHSEPPTGKVACCWPDPMPFLLALSCPWMLCSLNLHRWQSHVYVCLSSRVMQLVSSSSKLLGTDGAIFWKGPIGKNGTWHCCWSRTSDLRSRQSMVFQMMAEDVLVSHALAISCSKYSIFLKLVDPWIWEVEAPVLVPAI